MSDQIDKELVRDIIEQQANETPVIYGWLRFVLLGVLVLTVLLCITAVLLPKIQDALVINPLTDKIMTRFAYLLAVFAVLGLLCIFWKAVRIPTAILLFLYFMAMIASIVCVKGYEKIDYLRHKSDTPTIRPCEVTKHEFDIEQRTYKDKDDNGYERIRDYSKATFKMNLTFADDGKEYEFSEDKRMPFYDVVRAGDRAEAACVKGSADIVFIVDLRLTAINE